jgi:hypothetical protein
MRTQKKIIMIAEERIRTLNKVEYGSIGGNPEPDIIIIANKAIYAIPKKKSVDPNPIPNFLTVEEFMI